MRLTILGGCGAFPTADQACGGYLVEHDGFLVLIDPGYGTMPVLAGLAGVAAIDAVLVSHGHPDHCADLNPLLRARSMAAEPVPALPVYAPPGSLDAVLALDRPGWLEDSITLTEFAPGDRLRVGPFAVSTWLLPHFLPNAGLRLTAAGTTLAYTGDTGPGQDLVALAADADVYLAEASYPVTVPDEHAGNLSSALQAGQTARQAGAGRLILTHLLPGTRQDDTIGAAREGYDGPVTIATPGVEYLLLCGISRPWSGLTPSVTLFPDREHRRRRTALLSCSSRPAPDGRITPGHGSGNGPP